METAQRKTYITSEFIWQVIVILTCIVLGFFVALGKSTILIAIIWLFFMALVLLNYPYLGVFAYIVFEYARITAMIPALQALSFGKLIAICTFLMWIFKGIISKSLKFVHDNSIWIMVCWLSTALISSIFATDQKIAIMATFDLAKWIIIFILIINLVDNLKKWKWSILILLLLNLKMSQHQIRGYIAGIQMAPDVDFFIQQGVGAGTTAFFANATDFGLAMVVVVPLAFVLFQASKNIYLKMAALMGSAAFVISVLFSGSRGAALAMFVMAGVFWARSSKKILGLILLVLFVLSFWVVAPPAWQQRFAGAQDYEEDATASHRIELWKIGLRMFSDHPLLGVGIGNYPVAAVENYWTPVVEGGATAPHSIFIQSLSELGLIGFTTLLLLFYVIFKRNYETRKIFTKYGLEDRWIWYYSSGLDLSLVGFIVGGAFLTVLYYPHLFIILAFSVALNNIAKNQAASISPIIKNA